MSLISLRHTTYAIALSLTLVGCQTPKPSVDPAIVDDDPTVIVSPTTTTTSKWLPMLTEQPTAWKGTSYVLGGTDRNGIDCSGFVHMTFKKHLNKDIPRSTKLLSTYGTKIERDQARTGDLVFFHTSDTVDHVGIYVSDKEFVHASTSKGVIVSKFSNRYWKTRYWQTRRIAL